MRKHIMSLVLDLEHYRPQLNSPPFFSSSLVILYLETRTNQINPLLISLPLEVENFLEFPLKFQGTQTI